jgi:hypothetical protein
VNEDAASSIAVGPDGNPIVTGIRRNGDGTADFLTIKLSSEGGATIWSRAVPGALDGSTERYGWVVVADDGDPIIVNRTWQQGHSDDVVIQRYYAPNGVTRWSTTYASPGGASDVPHGAALDPAGNILIIGNKNGDMLALKVAPVGGSLVWARSWDGGVLGWDEGVCVTTGVSGDVVIGGSCVADPHTFSQDAAVLGLDPASGAIRWTHVVDGGAGMPDAVQALATNPQGDIFAVGFISALQTGEDILSTCYQQELSDAPEVDASVMALSITPNPFRAEAILRVGWGVSAAGYHAGDRGTVRVFDAAGRLVRRLDLVSMCGPTTIAWDGTDEEGNTVAAGMYFVRLDRPGGAATQKLIRLPRSCGRSDQ